MILNKRTLESYKNQFKDTSKDKIIEINYELSKKLCEIEEHIHKELETINSTRNFIGLDKIKWSYEGMEATYKAMLNLFFEESEDDIE